MTDSDHEELIRLEKAGNVFIGVDRVAARKLFTDVSIRSIAEVTDYTPHLEKSIVLSFFVLAPLSLIGGIVAAFVGFGWWGVAALVAYPILYMAFQGDSSRGGVGSYPISILLFVVIGIYAFDFFSAHLLMRSVVLFVFALWCARMTYVTATHFYRSMALKSTKLFSFLSGGIQLRRVG